MSSKLQTSVFQISQALYVQWLDVQLRDVRFSTNTLCHISHIKATLMPGMDLSQMSNVIRPTDVWCNQGELVWLWRDCVTLLQVVKRERVKLWNAICQFPPEVEMDSVVIHWNIRNMVVLSGTSYETDKCRGCKKWKCDLCNYFYLIWS